jgi:hypothetical protein
VQRERAISEILKPKTQKADEHYPRLGKGTGNKIKRGKELLKSCPNPETNATSNHI